MPELIGLEDISQKITQSPQYVTGGDVILIGVENTSIMSRVKNIGSPFYFMHSFKAFCTFSSDNCLKFDMTEFYLVNIFIILFVFQSCQKYCIHTIHPWMFL